MAARITSCCVTNASLRGLRCLGSTSDQGAARGLNPLGCCQAPKWSFEALGRALYPTRVVASQITVDPQVCGGKPCVRGTRILVRNILGMLAGGYTVDRILEAYPELTREDVSAAIEYASQVVDEEKVLPRE